MEAEQKNGNQSNETRDLLFAVGGAALMVLGATMVISHPVVKRFLGQTGVGDLIEGAMPDLERYLKLRSM